LSRALRAFDAKAFAERHGGYKESFSQKSHEYLLICPCGSDRLRWNSQKGTWICWGHPRTAPHRTGDTLELVRILEDVDELGAIDLVMKMYTGGDANLGPLTGGLRSPEKPQVRLLPSMIWPRGVERLTEPCGPHDPAWHYLRGRGLTDDQIRHYGIGFGRMGRYEDYILFPVHMDRTMVYYQARAIWDPPAHLDKAGKKFWVSATNYKKTKNPVAAGKLATSGEVLFNYDVASTYEHIVICEGPVDAIKVGLNAVALLGKVGQAVKAERLRRTSARIYTIYLDRGEEEREYARTLARELHGYGDIYIVEPPEGYDPGDLTPAQNASVIQTAQRFDPNRLESALR
jgi:hypothetical protein